jgi:hypothetical protein
MSWGHADAEKGHAIDVHNTAENMLRCDVDITSVTRFDGRRHARVSDCVRHTPA